MAKNGKSDKRTALEAMLAVERDCREKLAALEAQADKLRERRNAVVLEWLKAYGEKVTKDDIDSYSHPPMRVDGEDIQPIYKRSKGGKPVAFVKRPGAAEELA